MHLTEQYNVIEEVDYESDDSKTQSLNIDTPDIVKNGKSGPIS